MKISSTIGTKLLVGLIAFTLLLAGNVCLIAARQFELYTIDKYQYVGASLTETLARQIDGDRAVSYLETGEKDDYYYEIENLVVSLKNDFQAQYVYVAVPEEQQLRYIWSDDVEGVNTLGFLEPYSPGEPEWLQERMQPDSKNQLWFVHDPSFGRQAISGAPIYGSSSVPVAMAFADFSMVEIEGTIRRMIFRISICALLLAAIYFAVYSWYVNHHLVQPIQKLTKATEMMTHNLEQSVVYTSDIHTGDELETLSKSFETMDADLRKYLEDNLRISAERERLGTELKLAASIQSDQLPSRFPAFPGRKDFDIYASMTPAKSVGGDFYDFYMLDDHHLALVIADVSGKGIPAALFMMISRILIKNHLQSGESPAHTLTAVNQQLMENNHAGLFVTVWLSVIDLASGQGVAVNAGHEHPALKRSGDCYQLIRYRHAPPVGVLKTARFEEHEFTLSPGDSLFVYTDGVTEASNADHDLFGVSRLLEALNQEANPGCARTLENVMGGIQTFVSGAEQFDDITMLCLTYFGVQNEESPQGSM